VIQGLDEGSGDGSPVVYQARPIRKRRAQTSMSIRRKTAITKYPASRLIEFPWRPDRIWMPANSVGSSVAWRSERPFCSEHMAGRHVGSRSHRQDDRLARSSRISSQPAAAPGRPASRSGQFGPGRRLAWPRRPRGKPQAAVRRLPGNASQRGAASTLVVGGVSMMPISRLTMPAVASAPLFRPGLPCHPHDFSGQLVECQDRHAAHAWRFHVVRG
jgi:hypothetical protein